jgi:oligopeptide transport system ATP-binding protein
VPIPDPTVKKKRIILEGDVPSPINPPKGCHFHTRCMYKDKICEEVEPEFKDIGGGHWVACHFRPAR